MSDETQTIVSEELLQRLLNKLLPHLSKEIRVEVAHQMAPVVSRLSLIESAASANGVTANAARVEVARLVGMLTGWFGTDGTGGTYGILIRDSAAASVRANTLAHDIRNQLQVLVDRRHIEDEIHEENEARVEKDAALGEKAKDRRVSRWQWAFGIAVGAFPGLWAWAHKHGWV